MKVITICGSLRFEKEMLKTAIEMELTGNVMLLPLFPPSDGYRLAAEEIAILGELHKEKIKLSDAILVFNFNNYIGDTTKCEIEFAKALHKEIIYYTNLIEEENSN